MLITSTFWGKYNRVCNSGNESGSLRFEITHGNMFRKVSKFSEACMKEREVYVAFLEKLEKLKVSW